MNLTEETILAEQNHLVSIVTTGQADQRLALVKLQSQQDSTWS